MPEQRTDVPTCTLIRHANPLTTPFLTTTVQTLSAASLAVQTVPYFRIQETLAFVGTLTLGLLGKILFLFGRKALSFLTKRPGLINPSQY